jgi:hypothetical protein
VTFSTTKPVCPVAPGAKIFKEAAIPLFVTGYGFSFGQSFVLLP